MRYRAALCLLGVSLAQAFIIPVMGGLLPSPKINGTIVAKDPSGGSILCYLVSGACVTEASDAYTFTADLSISGPQNVPCADPVCRAYSPICAR
ncbi:hypothetical protein CALCODRAFT_500329 [Calocera cornea HHB12733]|uniref:Uncharacterized protein n=1 Tax=Calocera cornea HHB12733 TaxID=1353952 RepID=A0A165E4U9_9BASI|nr:hypothetical protein CALCODRAFT_500329 [Calocera cornea HHB12733]